jgi:hypothetical protein
VTVERLHYSPDGTMQPVIQTDAGASAPPIHQHHRRGPDRGGNASAAASARAGLDGQSSA